MLKTLNTSLIAILLASISLIALASDLSTSPSNITECVAYYGGSVTYAFALARIDSSGYYGEGYVEVGLLERGRFYGFYMEIRAEPNSGVLAYSYIRSTSLPYFYIHSYKEPVYDHTLFSWGITYVGGTWDASAGVGATVGGYCIY